MAKNKSSTEGVKTETDSLLAEFKSSWDMIIAIDNRRHQIVQIQVAITTAAFAVVAVLFKDATSINYVSVFVSTTILLSAASGCNVSERILLSERAANVRYRRKINLIRHMLLEASISPRVADYLTNYRNIGIKSYGDTIDEIGSTLRSLLKILKIMRLALVIGAIACAISFFWLTPDGQTFIDFVLRKMGFTTYFARQESVWNRLFCFGS